MRFSLLLVVSFQAITLCGCFRDPESQKPVTTVNITNPKLKEYQFFADMYGDDYFPDFLVDKCRAILIDFCIQIEKQKPTSDEELFALSHLATNRINELGDEFLASGSDLETGAREALGADFDFIVKAYGFDVDIEEVIATREW